MKNNERRLPVNIKKRCLIIEDDLALVSYYKTELHAPGFTFDIAGCLKDAISLLRANRYTYLITDGRFPLTNETEPQPNVGRVLLYILAQMNLNYRRPVNVLISADEKLTAFAEQYKRLKILDAFYPKGEVDFTFMKDLRDQYPSGLSYGRRISDDIRAA